MAEEKIVSASEDREEEGEEFSPVSGGFSILKGFDRRAKNGGRAIENPPRAPQGGISSMSASSYKGVNLFSPPLLGGLVALLSGGSSGIGFSIAKLFLQCGAQVAILSRKQQNAEKAKQELIKHGASPSSIAAFECDVADSSACSSVVSQTVGAFGGLDILVNAAGVCHDNLLIKATPEEILSTFQVNVFGPLNLSRAALRPMLSNRSGAILSIGSIAGEVGNSGQCVYSASKAALVGFTRSLSSEVSSKGIRVNLISPGFIETPMTSKLSTAQRQALTGRIPAGRFGEPEEVAHLAAFLASPASRYITGQNLSIHGGFR